MTQEHPITPPPDLVEQWDAEAPLQPLPDQIYVATQAARWGADQELEVCCEWVSQFNYDDYSYGDRLRAARRSPKPPSLKAQALAVLDHTPKGWGLAEVDLDTIRRALESLPD